MTYREFSQKNYPERCHSRYEGGCLGCPGDIVKDAPSDINGKCLHEISKGTYGCDECWDLPMEQSAKKTRQSEGSVESTCWSGVGPPLPKV